MLLAKVFITIFAEVAERRACIAIDKADVFPIRSYVVKGQRRGRRAGPTITQRLSSNERRGPRNSGKGIVSMLRKSKGPGTLAWPIETPTLGEKLTIHAGTSSVSDLTWQKNQPNCLTIRENQEC